MEADESCHGVGPGMRQSVLFVTPRTRRQSQDSVVDLEQRERVPVRKAGPGVDVPAIGDPLDLVHHEVTVDQGPKALDSTGRLRCRYPNAGADVARRPREREAVGRKVHLAAGAEASEQRVRNGCEGARPLHLQLDADGTQGDACSWRGPPENRGGAEHDHSTQSLRCAGRDPQTASSASSTVEPGSG